MARIEDRNNSVVVITDMRQTVDGNLEVEFSRLSFDDYELRISDPEWRKVRRERITDEQFISNMSDGFI